MRLTWPTLPLSTPPFSKWTGRLLLASLMAGCMAIGAYCFAPAGNLEQLPQSGLEARQLVIDRAQTNGQRSRVAGILISEAKATIELLGNCEGDDPLHVHSRKACNCMKDQLEDILALK